MGRLCLSVGWENGLKRGLKTVSFNLPVIKANGSNPYQTPRPATSNLGLHCLPMSQSRFYRLPSLQGTLTSQDKSSAAII